MFLTKRGGLWCPPLHRQWCPTRLHNMIFFLVFSFTVTHLWQVIVVFLYRTDFFSGFFVRQMYISKVNQHELVERKNCSRGTQIRQTSWWWDPNAFGLGKTVPAALQVPFEKHWTIWSLTPHLSHLCRADPAAPSRGSCTLNFKRMLPFIHPIIHPFNKYLSRAYYMFTDVPGTRDTTGGK